MILDHTVPKYDVPLLTLFFLLYLLSLLPFLIFLMFFHSFEAAVHTQAVGNFLGETFAMCDTLRLAFFSRCDLWNTGVVSALLQACHGLEWPGAQDGH